MHLQDVHRVNPLARSERFLADFHGRVTAGDEVAARRMAYALGLHRQTPQALFERDDEWLRRLVETHVPRVIRRRRRSDRVIGRYAA